MATFLRWRRRPGWTRGEACWEVSPKSRQESTALGGSQQGGQDSMRKGHVFGFEGVRKWRVEPRHARGRGLEVEERLFAHQGDQLGGEAARPWGLVHDHHLTGLLDAFGNGLDIHRPQSAKIDDLGAHTVLLRARGGVERL